MSFVILRSPSGLTKKEDAILGGILAAFLILGILATLFCCWWDDAKYRRFARYLRKTTEVRYQPAV